MNTEYRKGFVTKEKIVRTPPEEQRKRMKMNMQNQMDSDPNAYFGAQPQILGQKKQNIPMEQFRN